MQASEADLAQKFKQPLLHFGWLIDYTAYWWDMCASFVSCAVHFCRVRFIPDIIIITCALLGLLLTDAYIIRCTNG